MKILKFGGTSVGKPGAILKLIDIIKSEKKENNNIAIVCSALHNTTNSFVKLIEDAIGGKNVFKQLKDIENYHYKVLNELLEANRQEQTRENIKLLFNELEELFSGIKTLGEASSRIKAKVLSYGERLSCNIISSLIEQHYGKSVLADTRNLIKTDCKYENANVNEQLSHKLIKDFVSRQPDAIHIFTGFIASNEEGETTTLGRGGSDYTASIIAAALGASEIQIWTDVDGIMTADPSLVKKAYPVEQLSYHEAIELSFFGAKVIYPPTMLPAQKKNIPIIIKNTFNRDFKGTAISSAENAKKTNVNGSLVKGTSYISEISLITIQGSGMVGEQGFSGRLFKTLSNAGVNIILITQASSEHSITIAIRPEDSALADEALKLEFEQELALNKINPPCIEDNMSIIAIVGEKMRHTKGLSGRFFSALGRSGVNVVAISQGSSELNISIVINKEDLSKAINSVHDAMFLSPVKTLNVFCCGLGNIGGTLLKQLENHHKFLEEKRQVKINIAGICDIDKMLFNSNGISTSQWEKILSENGEKTNINSFIKKAADLNLPNSVFIDNTGSSEVAGLYTTLLKQSMSIVACNKIGVSSSLQYYKNCKELAHKNNVDFWYETSVGAGLPIIKTIYDLLISGDRIIKIEAILSGTISYIFNNYKGSRTFAEVVKDAQDKGFTEPNPRDDLSGLDFARKVLILAREIGLDMEIDDINLQPILPEKCMNAKTVDDFYKELEASEDHFKAYKDKAEAENKALHWVGTLTEGIPKIELQMLDSNHPFYNLTGSDNIVSLTTNRYLNNPMVIKGPGAGAEVTAAGVLADLVRVAAQ